MMGVGMKKYKRGTKVKVTFEGTVISSHDPANGSVPSVRVSVKGMKPSWWAVVPESVVKSEEELAEIELRYREFLAEEARRGYR